MLMDTKTMIDSISTVPEVHITFIRSSHNVGRYKGKNIKPMTNIISTVPEVQKINVKLGNFCCLDADCLVVGKARAVLGVRLGNTM